MQCCKLHFPQCSISTDLRHILEMIQSSKVCISEKSSDKYIGMNKQ